MDQEMLAADAESERGGGEQEHAESAQEQGPASMQDPLKDPLDGDAALRRFNANRYTRKIFGLAGQDAEAEKLTHKTWFGLRTKTEKAGDIRKDLDGARGKKVAKRARKRAKQTYKHLSKRNSELREYHRLAGEGLQLLDARKKQLKDDPKKVEGDPRWNADLLAVDSRSAEARIEDLLLWQQLTETWTDQASDAYDSIGDKSARGADISSELATVKQLQDRRVQANRMMARAEGTREFFEDEVGFQWKPAYMSSWLGRLAQWVGSKLVAGAVEMLTGGAVTWESVARLVKDQNHGMKASSGSTSDGKPTETLTPGDGGRKITTQQGFKGFIAELADAQKKAGVKATELGEPLNGLYHHLLTFQDVLGVFSRAIGTFAIWATLVGAIPVALSATGALVIIKVIQAALSLGLGIWTKYISSRNKTRLKHKLAAQSQSGEHLKSAALGGVGLLVGARGDGSFLDAQTNYESSTAQGQEGIWSEVAGKATGYRNPRLDGDKVVTAHNLWDNTRDNWGEISKTPEPEDTKQEQDAKQQAKTQLKKQDRVRQSGLSLVQRAESCAASSGPFAAATADLKEGLNQI
ncbi:MAG: hypothetical protein VX899_03645 [Myxococcota bacterium]|nr:hypothetical protein [Myxococcota bacterium]